MKLTKKNYYSLKANQEFFSVSQFKAFMKCPAAALAEVKGEYKREKTTALLVGSYIDSYFEGEKSLEQFKAENPEIFKKDGSLKAEYIQAEEIIKRIERDKLFMEYISGKKQVIMTGEISGIPFKIKTDDLHRDKIVDLKIVRDFEDLRDSERGLVPWFEYWGYDLQGAAYQEIARQNGKGTLPFYLAAATKEKVTDLDIVHIPDEVLLLCLDKIKRDIVLFDAIKKGIVEPERCGKCDYCKATKVLTEPTEAEEYYLF